MPRFHVRPVNFPLSVWRIRVLCASTSRPIKTERIAAELFQHSNGRRCGGLRSIFQSTNHRFFQMKRFEHSTCRAMCADKVQVVFCSRIRFWQWNGLRTAYRPNRFSHFIETPNAAKCHAEMKIDSLNSERCEHLYIEILERWSGVFVTRRSHLHTARYSPKCLQLCHY